MKLVEHLSLTLFFVLMIFKRFYLVKIGLIFDGSQLSFVTWYHKILSVCLLGCKKLLISTWKPTNFHNRHHTTVLQDKSKNGTFVNDKLLGIDVKIGLKNGDIIGLAYFTKDMTMKNCNAFKFSVQESKISPNKSFPTLIESSENNQQNIQAKNKTVEFVSDQSIEFISDIIKPKNAKRKRKY